MKDDFNDTFPVFLELISSDTILCLVSSSLVKDVVAYPASIIQ